MSTTFRRMPSPFGSRALQSHGSARRQSSRRRGVWLGGLWLLAVAGPALWAQAPQAQVVGEGRAGVALTLARGGTALHAVVVGATATEPVQAAAHDLADTLQRISGARFEVRPGDGTSGLAVGTAADFPAMGLTPGFAPGPFHQDDYLLRSHAQGVWLIGASGAAVDLAVWDFLYRLGYRLYFLTDTWEVVPHTPEPQIAVDTLETPDYINRRAPRGAPWSDTELWGRWQKRNRVTSAFVLSTGHAYDQIIRDNQAEFDAHPEYLALVDGKRGGNKFCIANPGLRQLVVDYAVRTLRANPTCESISMEPSDGGGWCQCEACAALGSVSDRVVLLANAVAEALTKLDLGPRYVGFYAYNEQSPPPSVTVHPQVVVSLATSFIRGGYTIEQMVEGWRARGATLGIREYHDVFTWSHDMPQRARGGDVEYLRRTIPEFYAGGARFMNSENTDSWGANGLGYWLTTRLLWDTDQAAHVDELIEDFLEKAFGPAREPMRQFYQLLNLDRSPRTGEDRVARLYRHLATAMELTQDPAVRERLADLVLYTRYVELYQVYQAAAGEARQQAFEAIWRHAYRMRGRFMLTTLAICQRERFRDRAVTVPPEAAWDVPEDKNPWKSSAPFAAAEVAAFVSAGVAAHQVDEPGFTPVHFSGDLVPARALGLSAVTPGTFSLRARGLRQYQLWLDRPGTLDLRVTGGLIAHYRDRGNVKLRLFSPKEVTLEPVATDESVPPDGKEHAVALKSPYDGLHSLQVTDGGDMTELVWPTGVPLTILSSPDHLPPGLGTWSLCFYVPKGTAVVGGFADSASGTMVDGSGQVVCDFRQQGKPGHFRVAVAAGQDGKLWRFEQCTGQRLLLTVPPCLARTGDELLLPREVVEADRPK
jgi:hypothetical protein